jgi:hypothetical protein
MQSMLIRPKKNSSIISQPLQLSDIENHINNISVQGTPPPLTKNLSSKSQNEGPVANFKERYFVFVDNKIVMFNDEEDMNEKGVLQIKYARLKKTHIKDDNTKLYGFILMAKQKLLQFFHPDEAVI